MGTGRRKQSRLGTACLIQYSVLKYKAFHKRVWVTLKLSNRALKPLSAMGRLDAPWRLGKGVPRKHARHGISLGKGKHSLSLPNRRSVTNHQCKKYLEFEPTHRLVLFCCQTVLKEGNLAGTEKGQN